MRFKVGDRVRITGAECGTLAAIGRAATIIGDYDGVRYRIMIDELPSVAADGSWKSKPCYLRPLTPPHQEQWEAFKTQYLVPDKRIKVAA